MNALKTKVLLLSLLSCSLGMYAQNKIGFGYDAAGNRIKREIIMSQARCQSFTFAPGNKFKRIG